MLIQEVTRSKLEIDILVIAANCSSASSVGGLHVTRYPATRTLHLCVNGTHTTSVLLSARTADVLTLNPAFCHLIPSFSNL